MNGVVLRLSIAVVASLVFLVPVSSAQSTGVSELQCTAADLTADFAFASTADHRESFVLKVRNTSDHTCLVTSGSGVMFNDTAHGHNIWTHECFECDGTGTPIPGRYVPNVVLERGGEAYKVYRWSTLSSSSDSPCQQAGSLNTYVNSDIKHPYWVIAPALITQVCSVVDVAGFRAGHFADDDLNGTQAQGKIELTADRTTSNPGEPVMLHIGTDGKGLLDEKSCQMLFFLTRSEEGDTRFEQIMSPFKCKSPLGKSGRSGLIEEDMPVTNRFGMDRRMTYTMIVSELIGHGETGTALMPKSEPIEFHFRKEGEMSRTWSPLIKGLTIALDIDEESYPVGRDIHLHTAILNKSAPGPMYGYDCLLPVTYELSDSHGQLIKSRAVPRSCNASMSTPMPQGKPIPMESTLRDMEILPDHAGQFSLVAVWNALGASDAKPEPNSFLLGPPLEEYATVRSLPVYFQITEAAK